MSIDYTLRKATSFTPYEIFKNTYNGRRILPAAVSRISSVTWQPNKREMARNLCYLFAPFQRKGWDMKSCYVSLRKNPAGSPENKKISYPGKGTRFGKHLFFMYLKIEYTL